MTTTQQETGRIRRAVLVVLMGLAVMAGLIATSATPAFAGEMKSISTVSNGKCDGGKSKTDPDCYHDDLKFKTHQGCFDRIARILGVDPKSKNARFYVDQQTYLCKARPPEGLYLLQMYHPSCPHSSWSSAQCRAWAKNH